MVENHSKIQREGHNVDHVLPTSSDALKNSPKTKLDRSELHQKFKDYLTQLGLRQTKQRQIILDAILDLGNHVDAEAIAERARTIDPSLGLATVYRSVQTLVDAGLLAEHQFNKDRSHFEIIDSSEQHHDHLLCRRCGKVVEFFDQELESLQENIANRLGYKLVGHRMQLVGECNHPHHCGSN